MHHLNPEGPLFRELIERNESFKPMKLYKITTTRKRDGTILVEDVLCEKHWSECKVQSFFQSDRQYKVTVAELNGNEFKCQDCHPS